MAIVSKGVGGKLVSDKVIELGNALGKSRRGVRCLRRFSICGAWYLFSDDEFASIGLRPALYGCRPVYPNGRFLRDAVCPYCRSVFHVGGFAVECLVGKAAAYIHDDVRYGA